MKLPMSFAALFAAAALAAAAPANAQRDRYYEDDERYEDSRYESERGRYDEYDEYDRYEEREEPDYDFARVVSVDPIVDVASRPVKREECRQQPVRRESGPA